jgi:hypothetical protein
MKAFKILVAALMFISVSVYAADKQTTKEPIVQKNKQTQTAKTKNPNYTWQDCVDGYTQESGFSKERAYELCQSMQ